jgi:hypothetical protein
LASPTALRRIKSPPIGLAPAKPHHPLAEDCSVDEGVAPERFHKVRITPQEVADGVVGDEGELRRRQRADAVVHDPEEEALQVRHVARRLEGHDLPHAAVQELVAAYEAVEDEAAMARPILVADDVLVRRDVSDRYRQV